MSVVGAIADLKLRARFAVLPQYLTRCRIFSLIARKSLALAEPSLLAEINFVTNQVNVGNCVSTTAFNVKFNFSPSRSAETKRIV